MSLSFNTVGECGKAEKFDCDFFRLDALRGLLLVVSVRFVCPQVFDARGSVSAVVLNCLDRITYPGRSLGVAGPKAVRR